MRTLSSVLFAAAVVSLGCSGDGVRERTASSSESIQMGKPATAYPEAVYIQVAGFIPCSGVVLAPRVVLTAGHCQATDESYVVTAPHAGNQVAHGNLDWSPFKGEASKTPDVRLVFLETPIHLSSYPVLSKSEVPPGTKVVDLGRTLNGSINQEDYVSPPVTILGAATELGFPFNYEALPDISEDGDSGGPIELAGDSGERVHTVVAIVDTDTLEQSITEKTPIDLFARLDVVYDAIQAQIAAHPADAGPSTEAGVEGGRALPSDPGSGGGCSVSTTREGESAVLHVLWIVGFAATRRKREARRPCFRRR